MMPALASVAPWLCTPWASSRSIHVPDSRVSRPARNRTVMSPCRSVRTSAAPNRRTVTASSGQCPAFPRTPSVPNSRPIVLLSDPHLYLWRFDPHDGQPRRRPHADRQLELPGAEALDVDNGHDIRWPDRVDDLARAP